MPMPAHLTLEGENQGTIEGSCEMAGREGTILVEAFNHEIRIPRDPQSGLSTGKRIHNAFSIVKVFDKSTPKLYQALCTGEHLKNVTTKWYRINPAGQEEHYFTHVLEDAIIVSIRPWMPNCLDPATESYTHMEELQFTYKKIRWTWEIDGIESEDSWIVPK
jgi:type VI secretion system secreted protein Hcp